MDKWTAKIDTLKKSLNDIIKLKSKKEFEIGVLMENETMSLDEAKKQVGSFWSSLFPKKEDIQKQLIDVDASLPKVDDNGADTILTYINSIENGSNEKIKSFQELYDTGNMQLQWIAKYAQETQGQIRTAEDLKKANQDARDSALEQNKALQAQTLSAKAGKIALQALAAAGNMLLMWGISQAIQLAATAIDNWVHRVEKANAAMDEAVAEYETAKSSLSDINSELDEQNTKISDLLAKDNLTYTEKGQLKELQDITKELMYQEDIEERRAERASKEAAEKTVDAYEKQYGKYDVSEENLEAKLNADTFSMPKNENDVLGNIAAYVNATEALSQLQADRQHALENGEDTKWLEEDILNAYEFIDGVSKNIDGNLSDLWEKRSALAEEYNKAIEKQEQGIEPLTTSEKDVIETYESISDSIRMIYEYVYRDDWNDMEIAGIFNTEGIEKTKDELIALAKSGQLTPEMISSYKNLNAAIQDSDLLFEDDRTAAEAFCDELYRLADTAKETADELNEPDLPLIPTLSSSVEQLSSQLEPQFSQLKEAYQKIFTDDGNFDLSAVDNSMLEGLRKSFAEIEEEIGVSFDPSYLEPFFSTLTNGSATADDVHRAFNDLATAYLYSTETLEQLNDETAGAIEKQLAEMGVTNAHEVVLNALSEAKLRAVLAGYDLSNASSETMAAILNEGQAAGITEQMVYALTAAEIAYGDNNLSTEEKIDKLKTLAQAYGDVTTSALATTIANDLASGADIDPETALAELMDNFGKYKVDIDFSPYEKSVTRASSSASKQAETDWKSLLDKETDLLEKQLAANLITFQEYTDKRKQIIENYYRDSKISAEEYYDALESMYGSQLSLYDKAVNAVTGKIDDEIDQLNEQKEAIENSYQVKIDAIQEEIDALNKANDARKSQIDLEKAQYEAERARNQRVNKVYDGRQFVYAADMEAVRDTEENLTDLKTQINISLLEAQIESLEREMENATKGLDSQIDALESYKEKWNEISGIYEEQQNKLIAAEILGADWESQVLNGRLDTLRSFTEQYISLQQAQANAAANAARIKAEAAAGNATGGNVGTAPSTQKLDSTSAGKDNTETAVPLKKPSPSTVGSTTAGFNISSRFYATMARFHGGLDEGYATAPGQSPPANRSLALLQKLAGENLLPNELPAILRHGELVITPEQQRNIIANTQRYCSLSSANSGYASSYSGEASQIHIDSLTISCPNVTNNSGAEYILKSLERLPLDNIQHSHRRRY